MQLHIGIDDTDSPSGGCTTYICAILIDKLINKGVEFLEYPILLRLNPNVPWKTRGNGSVCIRLKINDSIQEDLKETVIKNIEEHAEFGFDNTNPGVVFHIGEVPQDFKNFSNMALKQIVSLSKADSLINKHKSHAIGYKNRRGIIGALSAVGGTLESDYTYELLAYRKADYRGTPRSLDPESVKKMDKKFYKETFNNIDFNTGKILIAPGGPDPVFYGIRGESAEAVYKANLMIKSNEPIERWIIYRSNQGTDAHLKIRKCIKTLKPNMPAIFQAYVNSKPITITGGHVILEVSDETGAVDCAAYEPTGSFRKIIRRLIPGDKLQLFGGVKHKKAGLTVNLEKIAVLKLAENIQFVNPKCPICGGGMESMGKDSGYRCRKCRYRDKTLGKVPVVHDRHISTGLYLPPARAHRHLTKPLKRYGKEKKETPKKLNNLWHNP